MLEQTTKEQLQHQRRRPDKEWMPLGKVLELCARLDGVFLRTWLTPGFAQVRLARRRL